MQNQKITAGLIYKEIFYKYILGIQKMKILVIPAFLLVLLSTVLELYTSVLVKDITDSFNKSKNVFVGVFLIYLIISIGYSALGNLPTIILALPCQLVYRECLKENMRKKLELEHSKFNQFGVGEVLSLIERISLSTGELVAVFLDKLIPLPFLFLFSTVILVRDLGKYIYSIILIHMVIYIFFTILITNLRTKQKSITNEKINNSCNKAVEILSNYEIIKAFNNVEYEVAKYDKKLIEITKPGARIEQLLGVLGILQKVIFLSMDSFVIYYIFYNFNSYSIGSITQYFSLVSTIKKKISDLGVIYGTIQIMTTNILNSYQLPETKIDGDFQLKCFEKSISVQNLCVKYNRKVFLTNLNFTINKGEKVAIIGGNGSGKTTFIRVLLGFYDYTGSVIIDDKELREISKESLRNTIAFVPQDSSLMNDTIYENICYGMKFSDEKIVNVAEKFKINETILRLEDGYLTKTGERAKNLSGGEKQKIALLRAAIRDKPIFILDEPTASIDPIAEKEIFNVLLSKSNPTTTLVIVHSPSVLSLFDKIILFKKNKASIFNSYEEYAAKDKKKNKINFINEDVKQAS